MPKPPDLGQMLPEAKVVWPRPRPALPVLWGFGKGFPSAFAEPVRRGFEYANRMGRRRIYVHISGLEPLTHPPSMGVLVTTGEPTPEEEAINARARAVYPKEGGWDWARLELLPDWFRLNARVPWGLFGDYRRESHVRHEAFHLVGFCHSDRAMSLMHPEFSRRWWLGGGRRLNSAERAEYWRAYP